MYVAASYHSTMPCINEDHSLLSLHFIMFVMYAIVRVKLIIVLCEYGRVAFTCLK